MVVNARLRCLCCILIAGPPAFSCGPREPEVPRESFPAFDEPVRLPDLLHGAAARAAGNRYAAAGVLYAAAVHLVGRNIIPYASDDGGEDRQERGAMDDDPGNAEKTELELAALGRERLVAFWDDKRGGVYAAASLDGGRTWGKNVKVLQRSSVGNTPTDIAADGATGAFAAAAADVHKGGGDALYLVRAKVTAEKDAPK